MRLNSMSNIRPIQEVDYSSVLNSSDLQSTLSTALMNAQIQNQVMVIDDGSNNITVDITYKINDNNIAAKQMYLSR
jgi:hypothetical protein